MLVYFALWIVAAVLELVLLLVGFPVVAVLAYRRAWVVRPSKYYHKNNDAPITVWRSRFVWLWGNEEDGVTGPAWYAAATPTWSDRRRAFAWSAWRNSVNNLRFLPFFGIRVAPSHIHYHGNSLDPDADFIKDPTRMYWFFCMQGVFSGFWIIYKGFQIRLGWKLMPKDKDGLDAGDYRNITCGTGWQIGRK